MFFHYSVELRNQIRPVRHILASDSTLRCCFLEIFLLVRRATP